MKRSTVILVCLLAFACGGCCVVVENRVFPKLDWYWSKDCKQQRAYDQWERQQRHEK